MLAIDRRYFAVPAIAAIWLGAIGAWHVTHAAPVAVAAAFDLTVTAGAVAYWLGVRGRSLGIVVAAGALVAKLALGHVLIVAVIVEVGAIAFALTRRGIAFEIVATELRILRAAIFGWRVRSNAAFTVHRASSWPLIAGVLAALTLVEAPLVHLVVVAFGHPTAAWILSALSLYGALWLVGDANALRAGGLRIADGTLVVALGARWRGSIELASITAVHLVSGAAELDVAIATANVVIELREPATLVGLFGRTKRARTIAFELDEPAAFVAQLAAYLRA